ncbi:MAG: hypothetical protein Q9227_003294 [Pyrenula ochraceoflavens]
MFFPRFQATTFVHPNSGVYSTGESNETNAQTSKDTACPRNFAWAPVDNECTFKPRLDKGKSIQPVPSRPTKKRRIQDRPTSLRVNRPLKDAKGEPLMVPEDIWLHICDNLHPRDLLNMLSVCSFFWKRLHELDVTFKNARINTFGEDSPEPLPNMKERELAELSVGRGCMAESCVRTNTAKAYWAYGLRLCNECLHNQTIEASEARAYMLENSDKYFLLNLIVGAQFSSGKYQRQQEYDEESHTWGQPSTTKTVFLKSDITKISQEYDSVPAEEREAWEERKIAELADRRKAIAKLQKWKWEVPGEERSHRQARSDYFEREASKLDIAPLVLKKMLPFKDALNSNRPPTPKSWEQLKPKLFSALPIVKRILEIDRRSTYENHPMLSIHHHAGNLPPDLQEYLTIHERRKQRKAPEQRQVLDLANQILSHVVDKGCADEDLVILVLNNVHDTWNSPANPSPVIRHLLMDDALMIIQLVITPFVQGWDDRKRAKLALESFRCPGCPRNDCKTVYKFEDLLAHIHVKHSCYGGVDENYHVLRAPFENKYTDHRFPFYTVDWPRSLPMLPYHQTAERKIKWDPNERPRYVQAPIDSTESAFLGRQAVPCHGSSEDDFGDNVLHAAQVMHPSTISAECKTKIAIQYGLDCFFQGGTSSQLPLSALKDAFRKVSSDTKAGLPFKHRCLNCVRSLEDNKFARTPQPFQVLVEHFERKHADPQQLGYNWVTELLHLPSDVGLLQQILKADAALDAKKEEVRLKQAARSKTPRKKPVSKAALTLGTPQSMDLFERLYAPIDSALQIM